jgi:SiaC family regulatory phosphoprotein
MENIDRIESADSPEIKFDNTTKIFKISGNSYPENCEPIYEPIKNFIDNYNIDENKMLNLHFHFNLINSTSIVYIAQIIMKVAELNKNGLSVLIKWFYDLNDEELLDLGEKLSSISRLPFEYVGLEEDN